MKKKSSRNAEQEMKRFEVEWMKSIFWNIFKRKLNIIMNDHRIYTTFIINAR